MKTENLEKDIVESGNHYLISETAKLVGVESHVLRYWEDELKLPIRRNELGHRYYTKDDVEQFIEIRKMKEQGLQLKAIRTVLTDSKMQFVMPLREEAGENELEERGSYPVRSETMGKETINSGDKALRLQMLLHNLVSQAVRENNEDLVVQIKESVIKELDYQFRVQEEENDRRNQERISREEEHYRKLDERLREYSERGQKKAKLKKEWGNHKNTVKRNSKKEEEGQETTESDSGSQGKEEPRAEEKGKAPTLRFWKKKTV